MVSCRPNMEPSKNLNPAGRGPCKETLCLEITQSLMVLGTMGQPL